MWLVLWGFGGFLMGFFVLFVFVGFGVFRVFGWFVYFVLEYG